MSFPWLIIALRQEPELYFEALGLLYRNNIFYLYAHTAKGFFLSSPRVLGNIRELHVEIDKSLMSVYHLSDCLLSYNTNNTTVTNQSSIPAKTGSVVLSLIALVSSALLYTVKATASVPTRSSQTLSGLPAYLAAFRVSEYLEIVLPYEPILSTNYNHRLPQYVTDRIVQNNFEDMDSVLGVQAELIHRTRLDPLEEDLNNIIDCDIYKWKAKKGEPLNFGNIELIERWAEHFKVCLAKD